MSENTKVVDEPPQFPLPTDLRFRVGLGKGIVVKVTSPEELGVDEIKRLIKLLEAQALALSD